MHVHRVREPTRPRDLGEFVAWIEHMNADMLAAGVELGDRFDFDVVHGHDWLVAVAGDHLADRFRCPLVMTIHATEYGRHQGWVDKHPQSHIHGVERWMANRADHVITCSPYMREHVADIYGIDEAQVDGDPERDRPDRPAARRRPRRRCARASPRPDEKLVLLVGRLVYEKGFQLALEALPERDRATSATCASSSPAPARTRQSCKAQARELGLTDHGTFLGWIGDDVLHSLYRIADLTVVPVDLRAVRPRRARGDGLRLPVHRRRHRRAARGRAARATSACASRSRDPESLARRWSSGCSPTTSCATGSSPRRREHVLSFDWADVARQTAAVYADVIAAAATA